MKVCRRCIISGKVQGVFFRRSTCQKASELRLTGWVKNLSNKNVEVLICGSPEVLDQFVQWLWVGPEQSAVEDVSVLQTDFIDYADFSIHYD